MSKFINKILNGKEKKCNYQIKLKEKGERKKVAIQEPPKEETPKPSKEQMAALIAAADEERMRNMSLPESKPSAEKIAAMKEEGRQEFRDNRQRVINHLKKRGLSNAAIAGVVGNIDVETGGSFDYQQRQTRTGDPRSPDIKESGGYGLFQFDDPGRKAGHETWYKQYLEQTDHQQRVPTLLGVLHI